MEIQDLNNLQLDVLREIGNIGAGNAATALAKMLNKKVDMDVPKVRILEFKEIHNLLEPEILVTGILLRVNGDLQGDIMFLLEFKAAHILVNMLMGKPMENLDSMFDDMELSALREIGNILAGSYLSALSALTNLNIFPSVPDVAIDMAGAIMSVPAIEFGKVGDSVLYIETEFIEGDNAVVGDFLLVPDVDSYDTLLKALGVNI